MRVKDEVLGSVVFIGYKKNEDETVFVGTGFIVGYPSDIIDSWSYTYLVTARHVPINLGDRQFIVRGNAKNGNFADFYGTPQDWFTHPTNETVDVAIAKINFSEEHDYRYIGTDMFLNDEIVSAQNIGVGDDVFFPGLFTLLKSEKNLPIMRMGNIALMNPGRIIPTQSYGNIEGHLVEAHSIGGLSGSPVFVQNSNLIQRKMSLLGLMHGHWDVPEQQIRTIEDNASSVTTNKVNMGIAIVVPSQLILETLNHPKLIAQRAVFDETEIKTRREKEEPTKN